MATTGEVDSSRDLIHTLGFFPNVLVVLGVTLIPGFVVFVD